MPEIYHSVIAGTADFVIVMEDLSDLKLVSQSEGMTALELGRRSGCWRRFMRPGGTGKGCGVRLDSVHDGSKN